MGANGWEGIFERKNTISTFPREKHILITSFFQLKNYMVYWA